MPPPTRSGRERQTVGNPKPQPYPYHWPFPSPLRRGTADNMLLLVRWDVGQNKRRASPGTYDGRQRRETGMALPSPARQKHLAPCEEEFPIANRNTTSVGSQAGPSLPCPAPTEKGWLSDTAVGSFFYRPYHPFINARETSTCMYQETPRKLVTKEASALAAIA